MLDPNKPVFHARCNEGDCPPEWKEGPWSPVSILNNLLFTEMIYYNFLSVNIKFSVDLIVEELVGVNEK